MRKITENELPKIRIVLRDDKPLNKNGESTFNYYIRFNGKTVKKPSGLFVNPKNWNKRKCELIGSEKKDSRTSQKLKEKTSDFEKYVLNYEARGGKITPKVIDDYFDDKRYDDFFSFYTENLRQKTEN